MPYDPCVGTIYHIARAVEWEASLAGGEYAPVGFADEGFIHCSTDAQVLHVANAFFREETGLVLLAIDSAEVKSKIVYENLEGGERQFPHVYGPLNVEAVTAVHTFAPGADGRFAMPEEEQE